MNENSIGAAIVDAEAFFRTLDRSVLGVFALPVKMLCLADSTVRATMDTGPAEAFNVESYAMEYDLDDLAFAAGIEVNEVYAEVYFWRSDMGTDNDAIDLFFSAMHPLNADRLIIDRLTLIAGNPDMHGYFIEGIWDTGAIEGFIANGIDPAIAKSMVSA